MSPSGSASKQARDSAARDKVAALRQQQQRRERRRTIGVWSAVAGVVVLIAGVVAFSIVREQRSRPSLDAVASHKVTQGHTQSPVKYAQSPPAGGEHSPVWLNCGVYDKPVPNENAVHSMEHGAVWVTYQPALPAADVERLKAALPDTYMVLSPFEGLQSPVVASAWGRQLKLTGASDPRLAEFVREFRQGPQTPEPGATCSGGTDGTSPAPGMGS